MHNRLLSLILLILFITLSACSPLSTAAPTLSQPTATMPAEPIPAPTQPAAAAPVITLERTACHGTCPIYRLAIFADGKVQYEGLDFVDVKGMQTGALTPDQVNELISTFKDADYFNLKDEYKAPVTDLATTITSFTQDGKTKTVTNYGGCLEGSPDRAPQALCDLEKHIDFTAHTAQWTGK
jgi:hypothetical protein